MSEPREFGNLSYYLWSLIGSKVAKYYCTTRIRHKEPKVLKNEYKIVAKGFGKVNLCNNYNFHPQWGSTKIDMAKWGVACPK